MGFTDKLLEEALEKSEDIDDLKEWINYKIKKNPYLLYRYHFKKNEIRKKINRLGQTQKEELVNYLENLKKPIDAFWNVNNHYNTIQFREVDRRASRPAASQPNKKKALELTRKSG